MNFYEQAEKHALFIRDLLTAAFQEGIYRREHAAALMAAFLYGLPKTAPPKNQERKFTLAEHADFPEFGQRYISMPEGQITFGQLLNLFGRTGN